MKDEFGKRLAEIIGQGRIEELNYQADIASQITLARRQQNISQQRLAELIDVAKSTIGRIEAGITQPKASTLYKISEVLNVPLVIDGTSGQESSDGLVQS